MKFLEIRQFTASMTFDLGVFEMRVFICVLVSIIRLRVIIPLIVDSYCVYMYHTYGVVDGL